MSNDDASLIALNEAGCMILYLVHHAVRLDAGQKPRLALPRIHVKFLLVECRRLLDAVTMTLAPYKAGEKKRLEKLHLRYQAARQALRILEALEAGQTIADADRVLFQSYSESAVGGPSPIHLGITPTSQRPDNRTIFLRAAAIKLWKVQPANRDKIVRDAVKIGILGKSPQSHAKRMRAFAKRVENVEQRPPNVVGPDTYNQRDGNNPGQLKPPKPAPEWFHWKVVSDLVDKHGYKELSDFI
jgi:hypothetical protein